MDILVVDDIISEEGQSQCRWDSGEKFFKSMSKSCLTPLPATVMFYFSLLGLER